MFESVKLKLSSNKNIFVSSFILALLVVGIWVGVFLVSQRQIFREKASVSNVDLTMIPTSTSVIPGQAFTIAISVNPNANSVSAGDVIVNYSAIGLALESVEPGPFFMKNFRVGETEMLNKIDMTTAGSASIILGAPCTVSEPWVCYANSQTDNYAILHFKAVTAGAYPITFSANTQIAAVGKTDNVLGDTTGAQVIVAGPTISPTGSPSVSPSVSPTGTSSPLPGSATLNFQIKFQGIMAQKPDQKVKITLKGGQSFTDINVTADSLGVYSGSVPGINPGTYDVIIKGPRHLAKNFGSVTFSADQTVVQNWTNTLLPAGDIDRNGIINAVDIGRIIQDYFPNNPTGTPADLNLDGTVNSVDIGFVIENYFKTDEQ